MSDKNNKKIPKGLLWEGHIYNYCACKQNKLIYKCNSWFNNGDFDVSKIIIVDYKKDKNIKEAFYVLFSIRCSNTAFPDIIIDNISEGIDRIAKPFPLNEY